VMIFAGDDKVFHQGRTGEQALNTIPFTADITLEPGVNTLVVVAVNQDGKSYTSSVVSWFAGENLAKAP